MIYRGMRVKVDSPWWYGGKSWLPRKDKNGRSLFGKYFERRKLAKLDINGFGHFNFYFWEFRECKKKKAF